MASSTIENYVKQLYLEGQRTSNQKIPMGRLAKIMKVTPGTATSMVKALADSELVIYEPREGARLTRGGKQLALHVLRRHRLVELFLVKTLALDWSEVHEEAENLEHVISDKVLEKIDKLLDYPCVDPHGDPIPTSKGNITTKQYENLSDCRLHQKVKISRIVDQDPTFLQFLEREGLTPNVKLTLQSRDDYADATTLITHATSNTITLGLSTAKKILVEPL
ncbi:MAG: metal-dependent transcriptional regulator [Kiritimatiellae bacterium]|nr:metal-dependent transcriptional regulator [Kiritimatiellia bacterium]